MSNLTKAVADRSAQSMTTRPKSALPTLKALATPPLIINGIAVACLLIDRRVGLACGAAGGCLVGFVMYWALYYFAEHVFSSIASTVGAPNTPMPGNMLLFGLLAGGKFILIAALMWLLIAVLHFSLIAFVGGFLVTQICVSLSVIKKLSNTKVTD